MKISVNFPKLNNLNDNVIKETEIHINTIMN